MGAIKAHMRYISRRGELVMEDEQGDSIVGREAVEGLADEWRVAGSLIPTISHRREAFHVVLSMPPETDSKAVLWAARKFATEEFALHNYAMVLHEPGSDPHSKRPHVHLIVRAQGRHGERLNPRKADLARWRQSFADRLNERGVAASATRRQTRGELQPAKTLRDHHVGGIERAAWPLRPGEKAVVTENRVLEAWKNIDTALAGSERNEDWRLAKEALGYVSGMPAVARHFSQGQRRQFTVEQERAQADRSVKARADVDSPAPVRRREKSRER